VAAAGCAAVAGLRPEEVTGSAYGVLARGRRGGGPPCRR
jgi:hypothetical protein